MSPVGEVQHPKAGVDFGPNALPAGGPVQISLAQLGFAVGIQVAVASIVFEHVEDSSANAQRLCQLLRADEIEIVGRSVILRECSPDAAHQASHWQIETGGAILPLVISVRRKV